MGSEIKASFTTWELKLRFKMLFQLNDANVSNDYQMTGRNCEDLLDLPYTSGGLRTKYCQTRVNKDTEGSYKVSGHMLCKSKIYLMNEQNTKEIK